MKGSPHLGPVKGQQPMTSHPSSIQRVMMNRQQAARSNSTSVMPTLQPVNHMVQGGHDNNFSYSPPYPRNPSQSASPSCSRPPGSGMQAGISPPGSNLPVQQIHQQQRPQTQPQRNSFSQHPPGSRHRSGSLTTTPGPIPGKIHPAPIPSVVFMGWLISSNGTPWSARAVPYLSAMTIFWSLVGFN